MLNSKKFLYLLPDVAYVAELLPTKKEHEFSVHSFRQINGKFMDEEQLLEESVKKLVSKLDPEEYELILPDFLFTNTIVNVKETSEAKVKAYLKDELLPELGLAKDTHDFHTTILTQHGGQTKVQLSALEKIVLNPLRQPTQDKKIKIKDVVPLSWAIKALISLEPSISIIQIGNRLYLAQHYIGIDQCISKDIDEIEAIGEAIKTLKGAEPSIQTVYLLTNELIEKKLKEIVSKTLPLQQLTHISSEDEKLPSHIKEIIEASSKTFSIKEFNLPKFAMGKIISTMPKKDPATSTEPVEEAEAPQADNKPIEIFEEDSQLPKPTEPTVTKEPEAEEEESQEEQEEVQESEPDLSKFSSQANKEEDEVEDEVEDKMEDEPEIKINETEEEETPEITSSSMAIEEEKAVKPEKQVIKNPGDSKNLLKMLFIVLSVFFITVALGIGIGLLVLNYSQKGSGETGMENPTTQEEVVVEATPTPTPEPTPDITSINKADYSILVVNATTTAGFAGDIGDELEAGGFSNLDAGNAQGEYEAGFYVLMDEENPALLAALKDASNLPLEYDKNLDKADEDDTDDYDVVIVLADDKPKTE